MNVSLTDGFGATRAAVGLRAFAAEYASRLFVGRHAELAALDAWLGGDGQTLLVIAPAGRGKSALVYRWALTLPQVVWVPISQRFSTARSSDVQALLSMRLQAMGRPTTGDWSDQAVGSQLIVVLDGLDEALDDALVEDLRALAGEDVRIVAAARSLGNRDAAAWAAYLGWPATVLELSGLDRNAVHELMPSAPTQAVSEVMRISEGDPLTAVFLAELAESGAPVALESTPAGLAGVFDAWWRQSSLGDEEHAVLSALARAVSPTPHAMLARVSGASEATVSDTLETAARLVVRDGDENLSFAHPRLGYHFAETLSADELAAVDREWVDACVEHIGSAGAGGDYVTRSFSAHLDRCDAPLGDYLRMVDVRWLEAWEAIEGGTTGFRADLLRVWRRLEQESWSVQQSATQMKLSALGTLLDASERTLHPVARREAVRLSVRGQRASIAGLAAITDPWQHRDATKLLLEVLDDRGFDLLLAAAGTPDGTRWPAVEIVERLLSRGAEHEALEWALAESCYPEGRPLRIAEVLGQFESEHRARLRDVLREDLDAQDEDVLEDFITLLVEVAAAFDPVEELAVLDRAKSFLDEHGDENLWWDSFYDEVDPRLRLAEAYAARGRQELALELLERVRALPYPFAEEQPCTPGSEVVAAWARCAPVPAELIEAVDDDALLAANLEAARRGDLGVVPLVGPFTRATIVEHVRHTDEQHQVLKTAVDSGLPDLRAAAVERLLEILRVVASDAEYGAGYTLYAGGALALAAAVEQLSVEQRMEAARLLSGLVDNPPTPMNVSDVVQALVPLLAATSGTERDEIAAQLLDVFDPPLCTAPRWSEVYSPEQQCEYIRRLATRRSLPRPADHINALVALAEQCAPAERLPIADAAIEVARSYDAVAELPHVARVCPERWDTIAQILIDEGAPPWPLATMVECAPSAEARARIARHAWANDFMGVARTGASPDLLAALPEAEAERLVERIFDEGHTEFVAYDKLPPRGLERSLRISLDKARDQGWAERAEFLSRTRRVADHPVVSTERDEVVTWVLSKLDEAPDESDLHSSEAEIWTAVASLASAADGDLLDTLHDAALARAAGSVLSAINYRRIALEQTERIDWGDRERPEMEALRAALYTASDAESLRAAFDPSPGARTYPWVIEIIVERGLAPELAQWASTFDEPYQRLAAWKGTWDQLDDALRAQLWPGVLAAIDQDRRQRRFARFGWIEQLSPEEVREHWSLEMRTQRKLRRFSVITAYAGPLGCPVEHADAYIDALNWFL